MNISPRQKKWLKGVSIFFGILLLIVVVLYYTIAFRLKDAIRAIVDKESNGLYAFDASKIDVSLSGKSILLRNASLVCKDTANTTPHYDVKIPDIFFSLQSIKNLVFAGKLSVDSVSISLPQIKIHEHSDQKMKQAAFHASAIFDALQKLKSQLEIRSFSIHKASFDFGSRHNRVPFKSDRISLFVKNFSKNNDPQKSFLSSDDIDLSILNQHWKLPDGLHEVTFTNLHFSGKNQFFEIDTCTLTGINKQGSTYFVSAQKLFFNSSQLTNFYSREELILDTLLLQKPDIYIETVEAGKHKEDSVETIAGSFRQMFNLVNFKYIDIVDGNIEVVKKNTRQQVFTSEGTNLEIYNFLLNKDSADINIDLISLKQKNLNLVTKDSLYELNIEEFAIEKNAVYLRNASYRPTEKNHNTKIFTFRSPLLKLNNVNFEDLLSKRLNATDAELYEPQIFFKVEKKRRNNAGGGSKKQSQDKFYNTLNALSELVFVKNFRIINGNLKYQSTGASEASMQMQNINALVLPEQLFSSDSLVDVKGALPAVAIGSTSFTAPKASFKVFGFTFQGDVRHNYATKFELNLANGTSLRGKDLSWVRFDWDRYQNYKQIQVNTMHVKELAVQTVYRSKGIKEPVAKDLPVIHLDRIDIDKISFDQSGASSVAMHGEKVCADNINSLKNAFTWNNAEGLFHNIEINQPEFYAKVTSVDLNTQSRSGISKAAIQIKKPGSLIQLAIPHIAVDFQLHSSDFTSIDLPSLYIQSPDIEIKQTKTAHVTSPAVVAVKEKQTEISIGNLLIQKGTVNYSNERSSDSFSIRTGIDIAGENVLHGNSGTAMLSWKSLGVQLSALQVKKKDTEISLADMDAELKSGKIHVQDQLLNLNTLLALTWNGAQVNLTKADSTGMRINKLSGHIQNHAFSFYQKEKFDWKKYISLLSLNGVYLYYKTQTSSIAANEIVYNGPAKSVTVNTFKFTPDADAETWFKQKGWQAGYTFLETGKININGFSLKDDSIFKASKLMIEGAKLTTMKDKRYPFKHGVERPMLARMINDLKFPVDIDSVLINNGTVYVREITQETHREAFIPLEAINAVATHVRNRNNSNDSLMLFASLKLYNTTAHYFHYSEAYGDSLSSFALQVRLSPVILPELSPITMPYANVNVVEGKADTLYADWIGNKYAAAGKMHFIYDGLKIKLMSRKDSSRSTFFGRIVSFLANDIAIHKKNDEPVVIFFVRDREKSVFNYWVKTKLNGLLASAAILQRKKHLKEYRKSKEKYYLPEMGE
ncbi:MAG: hypothetical protein J0I84_02300 [Terrimonas sp.]|mgnify:FL=1|nr:hypothetical protein [Terrimonas sp.]OJY95399.1 MAG: hypothetical protein BGP13_14000 [Sphingobacteriales bacterium 40-81]